MESDLKLFSSVYKGQRFTCRTDRAPFFPYPEHTTTSRSGSGLLWNWMRRKRERDLFHFKLICLSVMCFSGIIIIIIVELYILNHEQVYLFRKEGRFPHGRIHTRPDVQDAVTHLQHTRDTTTVPHQQHYTEVTRGQESQCSCWERHPA